MARIQLQTENTNNPEIKGIFEEIKGMVGQIPAPYRAFGRLAHVVGADWNKTKRVLKEGNLPVALKESIALAVSTANDCHFCIDIHRKNLAKHGLSEDVIDKVAQASSDDPKIDLALKFAVQATKDPHKLTREDFSKMKEVGYSEEDILEVLTVMEMYTGYNKIIVALGIQLDD